MDDYLLRKWSVEPRLYGAVYFPPPAAPQPVNVSVHVPLLPVGELHLEPLTYLPQVPAKYNLTVMVNQSSYHALPAVLGMAHSALSQYDPFKVCWMEATGKDDFGTTRHHGDCLGDWYNRLLFEGDPLASKRFIQQSTGECENLPRRAANS